MFIIYKGKDLDILQSQAQVILGEMKKVPGVVNAQVEQEVKIPQIEIYNDRDASLNNGINIGMMNEQLEMGFMGMQANEILDGNERYPVVIKYDPSWKGDIESLGNTLVPTGYEKSIPLNQVAIIQKTKGQNKISHDKAQRRINITGFVQNRDVVSIVEDIKTNVDKIKMPDGYFISYEGERL